MKPRVLFVTQTLGDKAACGIGLIGKLIGETLEKHPDFEFKVLYADEWSTVYEANSQFQPQVIIYNWHVDTTVWLNDPASRLPISVPQLCMVHDWHQGLTDTFSSGSSHHGFEYIITDDPSVVGNEHVFITNRLLPPSSKLTYQEGPVPIIGFQGFGAPHKGIARLAHTIQSEFDEAIFRLHIPFGYYEDLRNGSTGSYALVRVAEVNDIIKNPKIKVEVSHELWETVQVVDWLSQNTINCYFYDYLDGAGIASSTDYGLAAGRPIALTRSHQMRNFWNTPEIFIENKTLKQIIEQGTTPLEPYYEAYSVENVYRDYTRILNNLLKIGN
jgi:hypothetical protein